jgi:hypothetical protein
MAVKNNFLSGFLQREAIRSIRKSLKTIMSSQRAVIFVMVATLSLGMFFTSPPFSAPDEIAHAQTSWLNTKPNHLVPVPGEFGVTESFPNSIVDPKIWCFQHRSDIDSGCYFNADIPKGQTLQEISPTGYPPIYYWVVGVGMRIGHLFSDFMVPVGGRASSLFLNLFLIYLLLWRSRKVEEFNPWLIPCILFPMTYFLIPSINPNSLEITSLLLFAYLYRF